MNVKALIVLILSIILWAALVVSLATPWFWVKDYENEDDYTYQYYKYNGYQIVEYEDGAKYRSRSYSFSRSEKVFYKTQIQIFSASLAFAVLALVVVTLFILCVALQVLNVKLPIGPIAKIIPLVSLVFCLLSLFIFCGVTNARKKDCERVSGDVSDCDAPLYNKFLGEEGETSWGGGVAFAFIIISSALNLVVALFTLFVGVFNNEEAQA